MTKPIIWIIDTSVFLNVLDVPGFNQDRATVIQDFQDRITSKHTFLLPFTSIIETGNHIAQLASANHRRDFAQKFSDQVLLSIDGSVPWRPLDFPKTDDLKAWLVDFPNNAQAGKGLGDHIIIKQWAEQCALFPSYIVKIWSLDADLQGYECNH